MGLVPSERTFSALRYIKTYLRCKMMQDRLNHLMVTYGILDRLVSNNGSCFTSAEFRYFCQGNGESRHFGSTPPLAERAVQIVKNGLKTVQGGTFDSRLAKARFASRQTAQAG